MFCSEKLDGMRATWIPAARGRSIDTVPFANIEKDKKISIATGLFSRYGKIIYAPSDFLNSLPRDRCLDGELWMGRQSFQKTMKIVKKHEPNVEEWNKIKFYVFDSPTYGVLFKDGRINNPNFKKTINQAHCLVNLGIVDAGTPTSFEFTHNLLEKECKKVGDEYWIRGESNVLLHKQELLPFMTVNADARLEQLLSEITDEGGEGVMLRHPSWEWEPYRSNWLFKYKPDKDDEAQLLGYIAGNGKHHGRLGSIRVLYNGVQLDIGGFTDKERELTEFGQVWAINNAGSFSDQPFSIQFPVGSIITFTYRELSDGGIPKEARFKRVRPEE
jgi:DNA ligase-1